MSLKGEEALILGMDYTDKKSLKSIDVSKEEGNIITLKDDGLYAKVEEPLIVEMRFNIGTPTCTITSLSETYQTIYEALRTNKEVVIKGYNNSARTDAPLWFYPIGYIANSNMATFQCVYQYSENSITAYYLQITSLSNTLSYHTYDMTKPDLSNYVTAEELAEEIANASHLTREIVTEIPTVDTAKDNVIYMYKVESATGSDVYQEYQLINGAVVLVGDTSVDLTGYQKLLSGTKGQFVSFDDTGKALAVDVGLSYADFSSISGVTDINNLKTNGIYNFSSAITNSPPNMDRYTLEVFTWYRYVVQRAFGFKASTTSSATNSRPTYYIRMYDTMLYSWTSWSLISGSTAVDGALSSASNNPISNKAVYYALADKQDNLAGKGTAGQFVGFTDEGEIDITEDLPVSAGVYAGSTDSRVEITSSSLVIKKHFRKAKLYLSNSLPSSYTVRGGPVTIDIFRLADGTYKSVSTASPVIIPAGANKLSIYSWNVSANVAEQADGTLKITTSAGGAITTIDVSAGTVSGNGSGGAGGDFNHILVWF